MAAESKLQLVIEAQDNASKTVKGLSGQLENLQPTFKKMAAAGTIAFGAIATAVGFAIKEANEAEKVQAQLNAVLESTHGAAGLYIDDLNEQAKALQRVTTYGDEAVGSAQALLLTFTNVKGPIFQQATQTILDMSTALGQDLKSSAIQVGKALQDPILGVSALRRVGVNFSEDQQKMIKTMVETGQVMEAQKFILSELNTEFGGSAAAQAATFAGRMEQLKNSFGDLGEAIGKAFTGPAAVKFLETLNNMIERVTAWAEANPKLVATITIVAGAIAGIIALVGTLGLVIPAITTGVTALGAAFAFLAANPIVLLIAAIVALLIAIIVNWDKIKAKTIEIWGAVVKFMTDAWNSIKTGAINTWNTIAEAFISAFNAVKSFFASVINWILDKFEKVVNSIISGLNAIGSRLKLPAIPEVHIPRLAKGGIVDRPTVAMIGEAGPEAVVPLGKGRGNGFGMTINLSIGTLIGAGMDMDELSDAIGDNLMGRLTKTMRV